MNMWVSALTGLLFFVTALRGSPLKDDLDIITSYEDGVVYVFNAYAVKSSESKVIGRMLSQHSLPKMPPMFKPIGSILVSTDETDPMNLNELSDIFEEVGMIVEKIDDEDDPKVIEIRFDDSIKKVVMISVEIQLYLQANGIIVNAKKQDDHFVIQIELDELFVNATRHSFTLEDLGDYLESEGFIVEYTRYDGKVVSIKVIVEVYSVESDEDIEDSPSIPTRNDEEPIEKKNERRMESNIGNEVQKSSDRKVDNKIEEDEELNVPLDFVTRSESLNKIRRRRSACPECKTGHLIKQFINNYAEGH